MPNGDPTLTSVARLEQFYKSKPVVGTTCLSIDQLSQPFWGREGKALHEAYALLTCNFFYSNIFQRRKFDYCIVDEASQITLPACVGPLRYADVFVLVGDQYQLPPVVRDNAARVHGLQKSLFTLLAEAHPEAIAFLEFQYRMNEDIMLISNTLVYDNKLRCANRQVASRSLRLPSRQQGLEKIHADNGGRCRRRPCWIEEVIDPR